MGALTTYMSLASGPAHPRATKYAEHFHECHNILPYLHSMFNLACTDRNAQPKFRPGIFCRALPTFIVFNYRFDFHENITGKELLIHQDVWFPSTDYRQKRNQQAKSILDLDLGTNGKTTSRT